METQAGSTATSPAGVGWSYAGGATGGAPSPSREDAATQLRARLLRLIIANESTRQTADAEASKPR